MVPEKVLLTLNIKALLSVVPRKFVEGLVPELPVRDHWA